MIMRRAWVLPVLLTLANLLAAGPAWAQGGGATPVAIGPSAVAPQGAMPVAMAAPGMYAPPGGYPPGTIFMPAGSMPPAGYAPAGSVPPGMYAPQGIQPVAYLAAGPVMGGDGQPQVPAQFSVAPTPDVYGSYGYLPTNMSGPVPPGYGPGGYGGPVPAGYGGEGYADGGYGDAGYGGQAPLGADCPYCGGQGCEQCGRNGILGGGMFGDGRLLHNGLLGDVLGCVAPYPDGGCAATRWYDFAVDYMMLKRDNTGRSHQVYSTFGINGVPALTADELDFGSYHPGFRISAAFQVAAASSLEFTYFGQFNYRSAATVRAPQGNLFSVFSNFGLEPFGVGGGFAEFDNADFNQINYQSTFDSFEINWRNRWMSPNCRYQGSWTLGVRHFILDEKFRLATSSAINGQLGQFAFIPARSQDDTDTTNNLTGLQIGGDAWVCLLPGLRVGGELQAGVYGNHMNINTTIGSNLVPPNFFTPDRLTSNDVAFIGQANLLATYRLNYQWTLRAGYQFLFVEGVALAIENFNPIPPNINNGFNPRKEVINDNGNVFYHGWNVGLEYMW